MNKSDLTKSEPSTRWVSFCISTYKRPQLLEEQLRRFQQQSDPGFEVVVSDNDPDASARDVIASFNDDRFHYFQNETNLGMIPSFNKSVERARTEFVVMVTDDDPIVDNFLEHVSKLIEKYPGRSLYGGFTRRNKEKGTVELIEADDVISQIIDPALTPVLLWSSCILRRSDALKAGLIPEYGSPHLSDHAFLILTGSLNGAVVVNEMFSYITMHDSNFSKFNFDYYFKGCEGFYNVLSEAASTEALRRRNRKASVSYLHKWFIDSFFNLKKYYSVHQNSEKLNEVNNCAQKILSLPYMTPVRLKYKIKEMILAVKLKLGLVKAS